MLHYSTTYSETHADHLEAVVGEEWDLVLDIPHPEQVEPRFVHAVVSSWFDADSPIGDGIARPRLRPSLTAPATHLAPSKPYAVGPLWRRPDGRSGFSLRLLGTSVEPPGEPQAIRLGQQDAIVDWRAASRLRCHRIRDLDALPTVASVLVRFETPTTRRQRHTYHPVPTEQSVLASWERSAATIGLDGAVDWKRSSAHITHLNGHTAQWPAPKARGRRSEPVGFVGDLAIAVPASHGRRLHQLAVLAGYAGTGAHATFGMGFTTLMATEEARP